MTTMQCYKVTNKAHIISATGSRLPTHIYNIIVCVRGKCVCMYVAADSPRPASTNQLVSPCVYSG